MPNDKEIKGGNSQSRDTKKVDRSKMLYEILLDEYETLGIFNRGDVERIEGNRRKEFDSKEWKDAKVGGEKRAKMLKEIRTKTLIEIRKVLGGIHSKKIDKISEKFRNALDSGTKAKYSDKKAKDLTVEIATVYEICGKAKEIRERLQKKSGEEKNPEVEKQFLSHVYEKVVRLIDAHKSEPEDVKEEIERIEKQFKDHKSGEAMEVSAALCFSGGGIRSATIGLGILQGLAKRGLLDKFTYLSSVSGGGYIMSWLSAWIKRADGVADVQKALCKQKTGNEGNIEPPEITHLRSFSNYMSPKVGLFSLDTWTLISIYLRNLLLNWTVFVPIIAAFFLIPVWIRSVFHLEYRGTIIPLIENDQFVLLGFAIVFGIAGVCNIILMRPTLSGLSWVEQKYKQDGIGQVESTDKVRIWAFFPLILSSFLASLYWWWATAISGTNKPLNPSIMKAMSDWFSSDQYLLLHFVIFGISLFVGGFFAAYIGIGIHSMRNSKKDTDNSLEWKKSWKEFVNSLVCGSVGGTLLYFATRVLVAISQPVGIWLEYYGLPFNETSFYASVSVPVFLIVFGITGALFVGIASKINDDQDREWMARFGALVFMFIAVWLVVFSIVFLGPHIIERLLKDNNYWATLFGSLGGLSGLVTLVLGFSQRSNGNSNSDKDSYSTIIVRLAPQIAAPVFTAFLMILIVYGTGALINHLGTKIPFMQVYSSPTNITESLCNLAIYSIWIGFFAVIGAVMGWWININKFSLHAMYRERLIRAYLGASRLEGRFGTANSFTGLDGQDNIQMKDLNKEKPLHVVNIALNLANSNNLRWQNRKAESFTATRLHCGSSMMGGSGHYRSSAEYGYNSQNDRAITLGTAGAISGAAASPNMGYYTMSSAVSFLMTLFNVRLGWWMGNPGSKGDDTYNLASPRWSPRLLIAEASGETTDTKPYVYLTDGGHFENLGIYEMVLRRCRFIVAVDSTADPDFNFSDLGNAIHKIRVDMGIRIDFEGKPEKGRYCAIATIKYSEVDGTDKDCDGILIYMKPTLDGEEPIDIKHYHSKHSSFPHETTGDQWFSESQFESYRALGANMMDSICGNGKAGINNFFDLKENAEKYVQEINQKMEETEAESCQSNREES